MAALRPRCLENQLDKEISLANRIRFITACSVFTLAAMEYINPHREGTASSRGIKRLAIESMGERGYIWLLLALGIGVLAWTILSVWMDNQRGQ